MLSLALLACALPTVAIDADGGSSGGADNDTQEVVNHLTAAELEGVWERSQELDGYDIMTRLTLWRSGAYIWQIFENDGLDDESSGTWSLSEDVFFSEEQRCANEGSYRLEMDDGLLHVRHDDDSCSARRLVFPGKYEQVY